MSKNPHYEYYCRTAQSVVSLLRDVRRQVPPDAQTIRLQRRKNEIVRRALFDDLRRTFLPPIDRDDIFRLCSAVSRVCFWAEQLVLEWQFQGKPFAEDLWSAVLPLCEQLEKAIVAFTKLRRSEEAVDSFARLQQQIVSISLPLSSSRLYDRAASLVGACYEAANCFLLAVLRNE